MTGESGENEKVGEQGATDSDELRRIMSQAQECRRVAPSVNLWTAMLTLAFTMFAIVVGLFGFNAMQDMRAVQLEAERIRSIRVSMEELQHEAVKRESDMVAAVGTVSDSLAEVKSVASWILDEQSSVIEELQAGLARSIRIAESSYEDLESRVEDPRFTIDGLRHRLDDLSSETEDIGWMLEQIEEEVAAHGV